MAEEKQFDEPQSDQPDINGGKNPAAGQEKSKESRKKEIEKEKKIIAILNHIKSKSPLPDGVKILETREMAKEVEVMVNLLRDEVKKKNGDISLLTWEIKNDVGTLIPSPNVFLQSTLGEGVIALPSVLIYFEENSAKQAIGTEYKWFVFKGMYLAEKIMQMLYGTGSAK